MLIDFDIKTLDSSLERYLIANFKNRQLIDLKAVNFADVTFLKNKISTNVREMLVFQGHIKAKFFS